MPTMTRLAPGIYCVQITLQMRLATGGEFSCKGRDMRTWDFAKNAGPRGTCSDPGRAATGTRLQIRCRIRALTTAATSCASDRLRCPMASESTWPESSRPDRRCAGSTRLKVEEKYLWPDALSQDQVAAASESEVVGIYPHRSDVPRETWMRLFDAATSEIGILVYAGMFLAEDGGAQRLLMAKARAGVRVRVLLGDPDSPEVAERGHDEEIGEAMAAKVRNALVLYKPLRALGSAEVRLHRTVLYNSIYRADNQLLVNMHVYGVPAYNAPTLHLRKIGRSPAA